MRQKRLLIVLSIVALAATTIWAVDAVPRYLVGRHQQGVARSIRRWGAEYSVIESDADAIRTAEMLEYVSRYYVPADGYRSTSAVEAALAETRQETMDALVAALREYTGADFGMDSERWLAHLNSTLQTDTKRP